MLERDLQQRHRFAPAGRPEDEQRASSGEGLHFGQRRWLGTRAGFDVQLHLQGGREPAVKSLIGDPVSDRGQEFPSQIGVFVAVPGLSVEPVRHRDQPDQHHCQHGPQQPRSVEWLREIGADHVGHQAERGGEDDVRHDQSPPAGLDRAITTSA